MKKLFMASVMALLVLAIGVTAICTEEQFRESYNTRCNDTAYYASCDYNNDCALNLMDLAYWSGAGFDVEEEHKPAPITENTGRGGYGYRWQCQPWGGYNTTHDIQVCQYEVFDHMVGWFTLRPIWSKQWRPYITD